MIGSTLTGAERLDQHPVHRATTLLREALLNSAATSPDPAEIWEESAFNLDPAPTDLTHGPVSISFPPPLAALLGATDDETACQPPVTHGHDGTAADASPEAAPEGDEMLDRAAEAQLHNLVQAFYRRQEQASLLVACSVATAFVLTLAGLVLLFSVNDSESSEPKSVPPKDGRSIVWTAPGAESGPALRSTRVQTNRAAKTAPLPVSTVDAEPSQAPDHTGAQVVLADTGRPLALGPLLPLGSARYLLLRGLPKEATLSAGRKTGPGTWMVKGADVPGLRVTTGESANGDYPLEVYLLDTADGPQARHRLILRVDQSPRVYTAGFGLVWPFTPPSAPQDADAEAEVAASESTEADASRARAQALLSEGDIAAARVILTRLAEDGNKDAAYELALTYDREVLAKAGVRGIDGDPDTAREWYTYAARSGHAGAAARLRTLAKPRGGA